MEYQKITSLLDTISDNVPRFITKKLIEYHDYLGNAEDRYKPSKQIRSKTSMLRSDLCDFSDACIAVKGTITVTNPGNNENDRKFPFKNNAPFVSCISKINHTLIDNAEDLHIAMSLYNMLEYSFWNYHRDEQNSGVGGGDKKINYSIKDSKSFDHKTSITRKLEGNNVVKEVEIVALLKHLRNFGEHYTCH